MPETPAGPPPGPPPQRRRLPDAPTVGAPPGPPPASPPSVPPPAPPPAPPIPGPAGPPDDRDRRRAAWWQLRQNQIALGAIGVALVVALIAVVLTSSSSSSAVPGTGPGEIFVQSAAVTGANAFTPPVAAAPPTTVRRTTTTTAAPKPKPKPTAAPSTGEHPTAISGAQPGLYGGTRNLTTCDQQQMISFLESNPSKELAWANAEGLTQSEVPSYIAGLTPVRLRYDTRVTNHGYSNGFAYPIQEVLEAGTAVLVDQYGYPRARCFCGNPLTPPITVAAHPRYVGPQWPTFDPGQVLVVAPSSQPITVIVITDDATGQGFGRPVGTSGGSDTNAPPKGTVFAKPKTSTPAGPTGAGTASTGTAVPAGVPVGYQATFGSFTAVGAGTIITQSLCDSVKVKTTAMNVTLTSSTIAITALGETLKGSYNATTGAFRATGTAALGGGQTGALTMTGKVAHDGTISGVYTSLVSGSGQGCSAPFTAGGPPPGGTSSTATPTSTTSSTSTGPCSPAISGVSAVHAVQDQTITISGSCLGSEATFSDGVSQELRVSDTTGNWNACSSQDNPPDSVTCTVSSWTATSIVITGFGGAYGSNGWSLNSGDAVSVQVWPSGGGGSPVAATVTVS